MNLLTVTQLNTYIKACFEENPVFRTLYVNGEISNFKHAYSGHLYFTLKDELSQLKCVMFASSSSRLKFEPQNGMKVICRGRISCYERDGVYQLYTEDMQPDGVGALNLAFEQLKEKLGAEGLFDEERKRPIPKYPARIGVVTSPTGAVIQDITQILARRFPLAELVLYPALVQGEGSVNEIVKGISALNTLEDIDVIIVGRGGGSLEDLWSFNSEQVARAVAGSRIPVISAVGHETDYTICDFVADLRAPTPSAAAELAVPDRYQQMVYIAAMENKLASSLQNKLDHQRLRLDHLVSNCFLKDATAFISRQRERAAGYTDAIGIACQRLIADKRVLLFGKMKELDNLNPVAVLARGYAVAYQNNIIIKSIHHINEKDNLQLQLPDGMAHCAVMKLEVKDE